MPVRPRIPESDPLYVAGGATDVEVAAAVATLNTALAAKQNAADAATDAELAALDAQVDAAVAGLEAAIEALPDDSEVAAAIAAAVAVHAADDASDADLADAVADLTALIAAKQDAATAATDLEIALAFAANPDALLFGEITRDASGAVESADVIWPDGATGVFTATVLSTQFPGAVDAYTITHGATTYTQPAMTRDSTGAVVDRPEIEVS